MGGSGPPIPPLGTPLFETLKMAQIQVVLIIAIAMELIQKSDHHLRKFQHRRNGLEMNFLTCPGKCTGFLKQEPSREAPLRCNLIDG